MNLMLFSGSKIEYIDSSRGDCTAIYIPRKDEERLFTDITEHNSAEVQSRYSGEGAASVIWRSEGPYVRVFGTVIDEVKERRSAVETYLIQDFVPTGYGAFYFVFGDDMIFYGIRIVSDDGNESWGISRLNCKDKSLVDVIMSSVSERIFEEVNQKIYVAVYNNKIIDELNTALEPFEIIAEKFNAPENFSEISPVYRHKDYGLLMLTSAIFMFLCLIATSVYAVVGYFTLESREGSIIDLDNAIQKVQINKRLGGIKNPETLLRAMVRPIDRSPSSIIHGVANTVKVFGDIEKITVLENKSVKVKSMVKGKYEKLVYVNVHIKFHESEMLLDQEKVAKIILETHPEIRSIERIGSDRRFEMKVGVQIE